MMRHMEDRIEREEGVGDEASKTASAVPGKQLHRRNSF
jgi:hypothetical protein